MFTGIIETTAKILQKTADGLQIERPAMFDDIKEGASIAVSGTCLSITKFDQFSLQFDVVPETWARTKLGSLEVGDSVNLERAMRASDRFDGHIVQGHVEGVGKVISLEETMAPSPTPSPSVGKGLLFDHQLDRHVKRGVSTLKYPPKIIVAHAREMRKSPTQSEAILWQQLRMKQVNGLHFRQQRPIGNFIVDFYCDAARLAIEVDGEIHTQKEVSEYDQDRESELRARGINILRFSNQEIEQDLSSVLERIKKAIYEPVLRLSPFPAPGKGLGEGANDQAKILTLSLPEELSRFIIAKGSITIDGVSLTVADIDDQNSCSIALIPLTLSETTLGKLRLGDLVNIETDLLARHLAKLMSL